MSDPAGAPSELPERKLHRLHPDDEAELARERSDQIVELDAKQTEAYLRWLETGEGEALYTLIPLALASAGGLAHDR